MVDVLTSHRRRRHKLRIFNEIEDEIDKLRAINNQEDDTPLWRQADDRFENQFPQKKDLESHASCKIRLQLE